MKQSAERLAHYIGTDQIMRVERKAVDEHYLDGFIIGMSEKLLLLQLVDGSTLLLNGYSAIRLADISSYGIDETFVTRALRMLDRRPTIPQGIDLADWTKLLASVESRFSLIKIETEKKEPGVAFIGRVVKLTAQ